MLLLLGGCKQKDTINSNYEMEESKMEQKSNASVIDSTLQPKNDKHEPEEQTNDETGEMKYTSNDDDIDPYYFENQQLPPKKLVDLEFVEAEIKPFAYFFYDPSDKQDIIRDDKYGTLLNAAPTNWAVIRVEDKSYYIDIHPELDLLNSGVHRYNIYRNQEFIVSAELINTPKEYVDKEASKELEHNYILKLDDQNIKFESGYYVIISDQINAMPRPISIKQDEKTTTYRVDLNNQKKLDEIKVNEYIDKSYGTINWAFLINNKCFYESIAHLYDGSQDPIDDLYSKGLLGFYDIDGDGTIEIVKYSVGDGGSSFTIEQYSNDKLHRLFWWIDEEEALPFPENIEYPFLKANEKKEAKKTTETAQDSKIDTNISFSNSVQNKMITIEENLAKQAYHSLENTRKFEILGQNEQTEKDFLHRLYMSFQMFNSKYAENEADIIAALKDLSWQDSGNFALFIWNYDQLLKDDPDIKTKWKNIFEKQIIPYWKEQNNGFAVFLVSDNE